VHNVPFLLELLTYYIERLHIAIHPCRYQLTFVYIIINNLEMIRLACVVTLRDGGRSREREEICKRGGAKNSKCCLQDSRMVCLFQVLEHLPIFLTVSISLFGRKHSQNYF
jgi:hypothetical protein